MTSAPSIPPPQPADPGEVTEALDVASKLWKDGNRDDAVRWVRRAAQAAEEAGDSVRMTALARASADLEESLTAIPLVRPSGPPPLPARPGSSLPPAPTSLNHAKAKTTPPPLPSQPKRTTPPTTTPPEKRSRFRVSIKASVLDPTLLVVRRLEDGKALPAGTSEGWLETQEPTNVEPAHTNGKSVR